MTQETNYSWKEFSANSSTEDLKIYIQEWSDNINDPDSAVLVEISKRLEKLEQIEKFAESNKIDNLVNNLDGVIEIFNLILN